MLPEVFHTLALTKIRRLRRLKGEHNLLVKVGQKLHASDKIADQFPETKFQILNIKKLLNFNNSQDARRAIEVEAGARLKAGDLIAQSTGMFSKTIKAQHDSEVILINGSLILLKQAQAGTPVLAGFDCYVSEIMPDYGVILETDGALIQCVWGNQKTGSGVLTLLQSQDELELNARMIGVNHRGMVVMGGYCKNANVLKAAKEFSLRGMIFSSMHPDLIPQALDLDVPVVVIEGFTPIAANMRSFDLLKSNEKRETSISAIYNPQKNEKPEIIIPLPAEASNPQESYMYSEGLIVRVTEGLYQGKAGIIKRIINNSVALFNGVRTICAIIQFNDEEQASIPLANLEILE